MGTATTAAVDHGIGHFSSTDSPLTTNVEPMWPCCTSETPSSCPCPPEASYTHGQRAFLFMGLFMGDVFPHSPHGPHVHCGVYSTKLHVPVRMTTMGD